MDMDYIDDDEVMQILQSYSVTKVRRHNRGINVSNKIKRKIRKVLAHVSHDMLMKKDDVEVAQIINEICEEAIVEPCDIAFMRLGEKSIIPESNQYAQIRRHANSICVKFRGDIKIKMNKIAQWERLTGTDFISKIEKMQDDVDKMHERFTFGMLNITDQESEIIATCADRMAREFTLDQRSESEHQMEPQSQHQ